MQSTSINEIQKREKNKRVATHVKKKQTPAVNFVLRNSNGYNSIFKF